MPSLGTFVLAQADQPYTKYFIFLLRHYGAVLKGRADVPLKKRVLRYETHKFTFSILMLLHSATYCS